MASRSCAFHGGAVLWCVWAVVQASGARAGAPSARDQAVAHFLSGQRLQEKGDFKGAIAFFDAALQLDPRDVETYIHRGQCKRSLTPPDYAGALRDFEAALQLDPQSASALNSRGVTYLNMKDLARAMADYNRAIEAAPAFHKTYYNRAYLRLLTGEGTGALADANKLLELDPDAPVNLVLRADIKRSMGNLGGAMADASRAIGLDPKYHRAWYARSLVREESRDLAGAWQDLQRALELAPTNAATLARAQQLTEKLGKAGLVAVAPPPTKQPPPVVVPPPVVPEPPKPEPPVEPGPPPRIVEPPPFPEPIEPPPQPSTPPKPVQFLPRDPNNLAAWNLPDTPWRKGDTPLPDELSDEQLKALATQFDVTKLDYSEFHRGVTTAIACMRLVYAEMDEEDVQRLYAKWAPIQEFPTVEAVEYFNKLNPLLLEFLKARGALAVVLGEFDRAWREAGVAAGFGDLDSMAEALEEAEAHKNTAASLRERLAQTGKAIEDMGDPPNPYAGRHKRQKVFQAVLKRATTVRILPNKHEVLPGTVCRFMPVVKEPPAKVSYEWNFGDQVAEARVAPDTVAHKYANVGKYEVTLTVRDTATNRVVGQAAAAVSIVAQAANAASYVMADCRTFAQPDKAVRVGAQAMTERWELHKDEKNPDKVTSSCTLKFSWTPPPGRLDPATLNRVQLKTAIEVAESEGDWVAAWEPMQCVVYFFQRDEADIVEEMGNGKFHDIAPYRALMCRGKMRPVCEFIGDNPALAGRTGERTIVDDAEKRKALPILNTHTGQATKVNGTEFPLAVVAVHAKGLGLKGYAFYLYAFDPSGQKQPIDLKGAEDAEPVAALPDDPNAARIAQLRENIKFDQETIERIKLQLKTETDPARAKELRNRIVDNMTEISRSEDMIASIETGTIVHRRSMAEEVQFHQLIESCHENVRKAQAIADNARRVAQLQKAFDRGVGNLHNLIAMLDDDDAKTYREWASQKLDAKAVMERDTKKLKQMTAAMLALVQARGFRQDAEATDTITTLEEVKFGCDLAIMIVAPYGALSKSVFGPGLTAARVGTGYGVGTGYVEGGLKGAAVTGLRFYSAAADVALAAMDGYRSEPGGSLTGAAKHALLTLVLRKGTEMSANRLAQESLKRAVAATTRPAKPRPWGEFVKDANFKQDQRYGEDLVKNYQRANNAFIEMASQKKPPNKTMDQYLAANAEALAKTPEGRNLVEALAQVECSYTAKMAFQAPSVAGAAKQSYNKNLTNFLEKPILTRAKEIMKNNGWNDFELMQFRHGANQKKVGFDKDIGVKEEGWSPKKDGKDMKLLEFQKEMDACLAQAFREKSGGRLAKLADWQATTSKHWEAYRDKTALELNKLRAQGLDPMSQLNPALANQTGQVNVNKVWHALCKGTREGQSAAFRSTVKEINTKIVENLPSDSAEKAYFEKVLAICKEGVTDPHAAAGKLKSFAGGDIFDVALQVKQQLVSMIRSAPRPLN
ncbi:MAG: PKD domain-containing protein [Planctomycetes bacterium]|nr:PKD domain-containing protein [Planctomycetota bacterium]